jgi:hypothetical protein
MCSTVCAQIWNYADYFPASDAIQYWCNGSLSCVQARTGALLSALEQGSVKYRRSDGKTFQDSVYELHSNNKLLIERASFVTWATSIDNQVGAGAASNPFVGGSRLDTNNLKIIGALLDLILGVSPGGRAHSQFQTQSAVISHLTAVHPNVPGLSQRNLEDKFKQGKDALKA